jgi:DnaK suppressor protein
MSGFLFNLSQVLMGVHMDQKISKEFSLLLQQQLDELLLEAGKTATDMADEKINFPDPTDRASLESDRNFELRIRDRERKLIAKIREAIERIEDGTYGLCESCEEEIGLARLKARPVTTMCIDCKTEQERQEKIG